MSSILHGESLREKLISIKMLPESIQKCKWDAVFINQMKDCQIDSYISLYMFFKSGMNITNDAIAAKYLLEFLGHGEVRIGRCTKLTQSEELVLGKLHWITRDDIMWVPSLMLSLRAEESNSLGFSDGFTIDPYTNEIVA